MAELLRDVRIYLSDVINLKPSFDELNYFERNEFLLKLLIKLFDGCKKKDRSHINVLNNKIHTALL